MPVHHPRAGIAHDLSDFDPHGRLITVHRALCTGSFAFLKGALFQPFLGILQKLAATEADTVFLMMFMTIEGYHYADSLPFPDRAWVFIGHLKIYCDTKILLICGEVGRYADES
jgi:hypothetical protein